MKLVALIISIFLFISCVRKDLRSCQELFSFGYANSPNCEFNEFSKKIRYNEAGILDSEYESNKKNILLLGDDLISGEKLKHKVSEFVQKNLNDLGHKHYQVINAGIRDASTQVLTEKFEEIQKLHKPYLTVLVLNADRQIFRDYFEPYRSKFCPVIKIYRSLRQEHLSHFFANTVRTTKELKAKVEAGGSKFIVFWTGARFSRTSILFALPGCVGMDLLSGQDAIDIDDLLAEFSKNNIDAVYVPGIRAKYSSKIDSKDPTEAFQSYIYSLSNLFTPWILMELE